MDKADLAWVGISTVLVLFMVMPGLALFYGGLVRAKIVLSILVQVTSVFALALVVWFVYGYSLAFTESGAVLGGLSRLFFSGMMDLGTGKHQLSGTIPEFIFATFQATFAGITCALIWAGFAQRVCATARPGFTWYGSHWPISRSPTWYGAPRVSCLPAARSISQAAPWCISTQGSPP